MTTDPPTALLDVNVLVALTWPQHVHHSSAHAWLAEHPGPWATTPVTEAALIRLSMNAKVVGSPVRAIDALHLLAQLRRQPGHRFVPDDSSLAEPGIDLMRLVGHMQVTDLHLVNLCAMHGLRLATLDAGILQALSPADQHHVEVIA